MKTYKEEDLTEYLHNDWILNAILQEKVAEEELIRTNQWLCKMENKRMIYADVYGDLIKNNRNLKVLDVGGGINSLTKVIARNNQYTLIDFLAHGGNDYLTKVMNNYLINWHEEDWYVHNLDESYDIIIANDIFPDVDQRLELFLDKMLPRCKEMRLVVTYYNNPKFYLTKRYDDSELMTFLSWDGEITSMKLEKYIGRMQNTTLKELDEMKTNHSSIYWNGRQVSYIVFNGDLQQ